MDEHGTDEATAVQAPKSGVALGSNHELIKHGKKHAVDEKETFPAAQLLLVSSRRWLKSSQNNHRNHDSQIEK